MKIGLVIFTFWALLGLNGCSSLHNGQGWEHKGNAETHEDSSPYLLEHKH